MSGRRRTRLASSGRPDIAELFRAASRGHRVQQLLKNDVWVKDLAPLIEQLIRKYEKGGTWSPHKSASATLEAVALGCAHNGGAVLSLEDLKTQINDYVEAGKSANDKLKTLREGLK